MKNFLRLFKDISKVKTITIFNQVHNYDFAMHLIYRDQCSITYEIKAADSMVKNVQGNHSSIAE